CEQAYSEGVGYAGIAQDGGQPERQTVKAGVICEYDAHHGPDAEILERVTDVMLFVHVLDGKLADDKVPFGAGKPARFVGPVVQPQKHDASDEEAQRQCNDEKAEGLCLPVRWKPIGQIEDDSWEKPRFADPEQESQHIEYHVV